MFVGQLIGGRQNLQVSAALGTKQLKKAAPKKKNIPTPGGNKKGLPKGQEDGLWLPNTERPPWLTGGEQQASSFHQIHKKEHPHTPAP